MSLPVFDEWVRNLTPIVAQFPMNIVCFDVGLYCFLISFTPNDLTIHRFVSLLDILLMYFCYCTYLCFVLLKQETCAHQTLWTWHNQVDFLLRQIFQTITLTWLFVNGVWSHSLRTRWVNSGQLKQMQASGIVRQASPNIALCWYYSLRLNYKLEVYLTPMSGKANTFLLLKQV